MDSFYGSEKLASYLNENDVAFIMVIKRNSDISDYYKKISEQEPLKGDWVASTNQHGVLAIFYNDKKQIFILTNCTTPEPVKQKYRNVPEAVDIYNKLMCGVDMVDAVITNKGPKIKGWQKVLVTYLFRLAVNNAWRYWRVYKGINIFLEHLFASN